MFDKPSREAPVQPMNTLPTTAIASGAPPSGGSLMGPMGDSGMPPMPSGTGGMDEGPSEGMDTPAESASEDNGEAAADVLNNRLRMLAETNPEALQKIDDMMSPEIAAIITILFGEAVGQIIMPLADDSKTTKTVSKGALERIGLDKFETMMTKAEERHKGIMAPGKASPGNAGAPQKATQQGAAPL